MKNFSLKEVQDDDHEWLVELHNDPEVLKNLTNPEPITLESHMRWWNSLNKSKEKRFIFYMDDVKVGFAKIYCIDVVNKNCVLGADIHKSYRGKGLAKHLWKLLVDECFKNLKMHRVSLTTASYNEIAQKVYKNIGFKEEGRQVQCLYRNDSFYDCICMYMLRPDWVNRK